MARPPDKRAGPAHELYKGGMKLVEIASQLNVPAGTVRRWKSTYGWDNERSDKNSERSEKDNERSERKKNKAKPKQEVIAEEVERVIENPDLTDKQRLFCLYYIKCFNATKAYQRAYECSYETAMVRGSEALRNVKIKKEIKRLKQARLNKEMLEPEDVFQKYMDIAFADITDYLTFGREEVPVMGPFGPIEVKDEETGEKIQLTKEINVVKFKESVLVDGTILAEVKQGKDGASIKLADRMKALDWLSEHMDMATEEQRAKISMIKAQTEKLNADKDKDKDKNIEIVFKKAGDNHGREQSE